MSSTAVALDMFAMLVFSSVLSAAATNVNGTKMKLRQMPLQRPAVLESLVAALSAAMQWVGRSMRQDKMRAVACQTSEEE
ncbi:hypothetical protein H9L39_02529 [Fusarium oxysporum f. sp. albedinis]|nr:hypothetical protein H9L39_02529 [Fusarium oxysporum f. sp. albedinis]